MKHLSARYTLVLAAFVAILFGGKVSAQYCVPNYFQGCGTSGQIDNFTLIGESGTSISDLGTGCTATMGTGLFPPFIAYLDHSSMSVSLNAGSTYTITATGAAIGLFPANVQIFVDFNDNFSFLDVSETVGGGAFATFGTSSFVITIPATAPTGPHRLRMVSIGEETYPAIGPCPVSTFAGGTAGTGETHDYTVNIVSSTPSCAPVTGLAVSAIASTSATVSWTAVAGATGYEWAVTTSATPPASGTLTTLTSVVASPLVASTTYYAHVRTKCGTTFSTWVTSTSFTTTATPTTCDPVTGLALSAITAGGANLNWTAVAGAIGYEWSVTTSATPPASGTATTLTTATASGLTASTSYFAHVRTKCSSTLFSAWVTVPFTTAAPSTCPVITGLAASAITGTGATVSWTPVTSGSLGYQFVINNLVTDPTGSGTNTTAATTSPTGLTAGTTYYAHVRDSCGVGDFSPWSTIPFTTLSSTCNAVTGLTATAITANTATLSWTMASGAVAAQYVVDLVASDPVISGTVSATSTAAITGLTASTTYYAHVRDSCGVTALSAWVTIPLTTLASVGITNVSSGAAPFSVAAYPNPVSSELMLQVSGTIGNNALLMLTDITGKVVRTMHVTDYTTAVDMSALPQGIYIIKYTDAGHVQTLKVNKQ